MSTPIRIAAPVTVSGGVATAQFPSPPMGYVWTGSISVPGTTPNSVNPVTWTATSALAPVATWFASQASGVVQAASGDMLIVAGTGVATTGGTAFLVGSQDPVSAAPSVWPQPTPAPPPSAAFQIANVNVNTAVPANSAVTVVSNVPVLIGTGLAIQDFQNFGSVPLRLVLLWSHGTGANQVFTAGRSFDIDVGQNILGWIVPNLDSFVTIEVEAASNPGSFNKLAVSTGFPSTYEFNEPDGLIDSGTLTINPNSSFNVAIPPFIGPVQVYAQVFSTGAGAPATQFDAAVNAADFTGASIEIAHLFASVLTGYAFFNIVPTVVSLPALICSITFNNRTSATASGSYALIAQAQRTY